MRRRAEGVDARRSREGTLRAVPAWSRRRWATAALLAAMAGSAASPSTGAALPTGWGYEKVSPGAADKNDADVQIQWGAVHSSVDGKRVTYEIPLASDDDEGSFFPGQVLATRTDEGWSVRGIVPRQAPDFGAPQPDNRIGYQAFAEDLSSGAFVQADPDPPLVSGAASGPGVRNIYRRDLGAGGGYQLVTPAPVGSRSLAEAPLSIVYNAPVVADGSSDLRHIVFETNFLALTPDAAEGCFGPCPFPFGTWTNYIPNVYEWVDGHVRLVSVLDDGHPSPTGAVAGAGMYGGVNGDYGSQNPGGRVMSSDGRRIFFTVMRRTTGTLAEGDLCVRIDGTTTKRVGASHRATPDPAGSQPARFVSASDDGRYVFLASAEKLTDDSTAIAPGTDPDYPSGKVDLYRYDVDQDVLIDLTAGMAVDDGGFDLSVGASRDGGTIYFMDGSHRIQVWDGHAVYLVAVGLSALIDSDFVGRNGARSVVNSHQQAVVSPDGRWLVLSSPAKLTDRDPGGHKQLYLYDRDRHEIVSCVSCPADRPAASDAWTNSRVQLTDFVTIRDYAARNFDAASRRLTFMTADRLVPEDVNAAFDVYQYDLESGELSLISPGRGDQNAYFSDASADGRTVFFATRNRVLPQDEDGLMDLYVARPGAVTRGDGGVSRPCAGDACQGSQTAPAAEAAVGTVSFSGVGNVAAGPSRPTVRVAAISRAQAAAFARSGLLRLSLRVSRGGTVTALARGRVGTRTVVVGRASRRLARGGTMSMTLPLSRAARRQLAAHRPLRISIAVSLSGGAKQQRASLVLTRPSKQEKGAAR